MAMKKKVYINGYFTKESVNGVPRYAYEIVRRMDKYFRPGEAELVIPRNPINVPKLNNIAICTWEQRGSKKELDNVLWGEIDYLRYIKKKKGLNVNLTNRCEKYKDSITAIHDLIPLCNFKYPFKMTFSQKKKQFIYDIEDKLWFAHKIEIKKHYYRKIVTVSECSKEQIAKKTKVSNKNIVVIGNGWEHILEIESINEAEDERIKVGQYYFFIGNIKPHKNFQWIIKEARQYTQEVFVIAGKIPKNIMDSVIDNNPAQNIIFLGYVSDGYMKYLMENAKALLFPSFCEGFGIPPLEKLALGGQVIVSDIPVLREIFGDTVHYIDKDFGILDINSVLKDKVGSPDKILKEYSWETSARKWFELIDEARLT
jgi:glycosyltransferase involved in cell wall biosynthesis